MDTNPFAPKAQRFTSPGQRPGNSVKPTLSSPERAPHSANVDRLVLFPTSGTPSVALTGQGRFPLPWTQGVAPGLVTSCAFGARLSLDTRHGSYCRFLGPERAELN